MPGRSVASGRLRDDEATYAAAALADAVVGLAVWAY